MAIPKPNFKIVTAILLAFILLKSTRPPLTHASPPCHEDISLKSNPSPPFPSRIVEGHTQLSNEITFTLTVPIELSDEFALKAIYETGNTFVLPSTERLSEATLSESSVSTDKRVFVFTVDPTNPNLNEDWFKSQDPIKNNKFFLELFSGGEPFCKPGINYTIIPPNRQVTCEINPTQDNTNSESFAGCFSPARDINFTITCNTASGKPFTKPLHLSRTVGNTNLDLQVFTTLRTTVFSYTTTISLDENGTYTGSIPASSLDDALREDTSASSIINLSLDSGINRPPTDIISTITFTVQQVCTEEARQSTTSIKHNTVNNNEVSGFLAAFNICRQAGEFESTCRSCLEKSPPGIWTAVGCIDITPDASGIFKGLITVGLAIAGGLALLLILYGAFTLSTSTGSPERLKSGQDTIVAAIVGLLFIIFAAALLRFIGADIFNLPGF